MNGGRGNGMGYETSSTKRRRNPMMRGRGIGMLLKVIGRFAAKNAPTILKGARFFARQTGNKMLNKLINSKALDKGAEMISDKFGGRGAMPIPSSTKRQPKSVVRKLIKLYGVDGARRILRSYVRSRGRGAIGKVIGSILSSILPF